MWIKRDLVHSWWEYNLIQPLWKTMDAKLQLGRRKKFWGALHSRKTTGKNNYQS